MSRDSKLLSRILRHTPEEIGIRLDRHGWCAIDDLLKAMKKAGRPMSHDHLSAIVEHDDKRRFTISASGRHIRAAQGHSLDVDLGLPAIEPPGLLYHGTASQALDAIFELGLEPGRRRHVHLSPDPDTAALVGRRHGKPVVLRIMAGTMHAEGHTFYQADNGVWLTDHVPARHLDFGAT